MDQISAAMHPLAGPPGKAPAVLDRAQERADSPARTDRLRAEAERFEAAFLAEMLRHAGFGKMPETFNGGAGEAAFAGSLVQEYANRIAATGRLGIAEQVYETLAKRETG
jgi:flagellar protein FlgJ